MSLVQPTIWDTIKPYKTWLIYIGLGIILLGLILFLFQFGSDYFFKRDIDKKKEAVNAALGEANQVAANIAAEKEAAKRIAANVNVAVQDYFESTNTTDATRTHVNAAIEQMQKAANTNVGNVNAAQVEEAMRGL